MKGFPEYFVQNTQQGMKCWKQWFSQRLISNRIIKTISDGVLFIVKLQAWFHVQSQQSQLDVYSQQWKHSIHILDVFKVNSKYTRKISSRVLFTVKLNPWSAILLQKSLYLTSDINQTFSLLTLNMQSTAGITVVPDPDYLKIN